MIEAPPFEVGAENDKVTAPFPDEMDTAVGALGVVNDGEGLGVTWADCPPPEPPPPQAPKGEATTNISATGADRQLMCDSLSRPEINLRNLPNT
ncbi:MAG: hypothetical protein ACO25D_10615 [Burkholderiaceae bacterium]